MQIVVLGMHRSGTSLVTGLIHRLGAYFGPPGMMTPTTDENPKGFWERRDVRSACDALLAQAGSSWWKISSFSAERAKESLTSMARDLFGPILDELDPHRPWVLKEPRLCLLFPLLRPLLMKPLCIHVHRDPVEVAQSLRARNGFNMAVGLALWEAYNRSAFESSLGLPRILVSYGALTADPVEGTRKLYERLRALHTMGLSLPEDIAVSDFVDRDLHRQRSSAERRAEHLNETQLRLAKAMDDETILNVSRLEPLSSGAASAILDSEETAIREANLSARAAQVDALRRQIDRLGDELECRRTDMQSMRQTIDKRDRRVEHLSSQISSIQRSLSWRITAPLRTIYDTLDLCRGYLPPRWTQAREPGSATLSSLPDTALAPTIVIPVYNALEHVQKCIESVLKYSSSRYTLLLIDDGSDDPRIDACLRSYATKHRHVHHLRNDNNLGYTRTINRGCRAHQTDIVLLNSDTVVTPLWLDLLRQSAYRSEAIGTVTPVSNNAGAFSIPMVNQRNELPRGFSVERYSELVRDLAARELPVVPTGNGFCLYIKRDVFDTIGYFDEENFPRGYGEENDFCMRAQKAGFSNVIDDGVFVRHERSASFGSEKQDLLKRGKKTLTRLHPEYKPLVNDFMSKHPLDYLRSRIETALSGEPVAAIRAYPAAAPASSDRESPPGDTLLYVIHDGGGGAVLTNRDLVSALRGRIRRYVLLCAKRKWRLLDPEEGKDVRSFEFTEGWRAEDSLDAPRMDALRSICDEYGISIAHVRSLIGSGPEILPLMKDKDVKVVFSFHDFYPVCPTIQLIDNQETYCGGHCSEGDGECRLPRNWFSPIPILKHGYVYSWRERMRTSLRCCDAFVTTSRAAKQVVLDHFPATVGDRLHLIEHGREVRPRVIARVNPGGPPVRVVCMGALGASKGAELLRRLFTLNKRLGWEGADGATFEFHIVGNVDRILARRMAGVVHHGPYDREDLPRLVSRIRPSFSMIASIWPETYCHTLTESWQMGLPVLASDIGTLRERILAHGGGWLLDFRDPEGWMRRMSDICRDAEDYASKCDEVDRMSHKTVETMAEEYFQLYENIRGQRLRS